MVSVRKAKEQGFCSINFPSPRRDLLPYTEDAYEPFWQVCEELEMPLNTHGGLLSYGHCGVGGAMAHLVETHLQMTGRAGDRQVGDASLALLHGDGGVLSSHVSMAWERVR